MGRPTAAHRLGGNRLASGSGLLTALHRHPASLFQLDEFGQVAGSFNRFSSRLREMVGRTRNVALDMVGATEKIRLSSKEVNDGAIKQS